MTAWKVRLTKKSEQDFESILQWTYEYFGGRQTNTYEATLKSALGTLLTGPNVLGSKPRAEIGLDIWSLHVARGGRKGRHFLLYRAVAATHTIEVLRILHDSMDITTQFSSED